MPVARERLENIFLRSIEQLFKGHRDTCAFLNKETVYGIMFYRPNFTWHLPNSSDNGKHVFWLAITYIFIYIYLNIRFFSEMIGHRKDLKYVFLGDCF